MDLTGTGIQNWAYRILPRIKFLRPYASLLSVLRQAHVTKCNRNRGNPEWALNLGPLNLYQLSWFTITDIDNYIISACLKFHC